jgi:hypothetical protein
VRTTCPIAFPLLSAMSVPQLPSVFDAFSVKQT